MLPSHLVAGPSSASMGMGRPSSSGGGTSMHRRSSLSPPGGAHMSRRPSSLRMSSSACDLQDDDEEDEDAQKGEEEGERRTGRLALPSAGLRGWRPEQSPTSSEGSDDHDSCDFDQDHFASPPCTSSSSSSLSLGEDEGDAPQRTRQPQPPSPKSRSCSSLPAPAPRRRPIAPLSALTPTPHNSPSGGSISLPKAQPLARTLFARMADAPHAGTGLGLLGGGGNRKGGKQKMIVATKPMRTTFELGLTSSELARKF